MIFQGRVKFVNGERLGQIAVLQFQRKLLKINHDFMFYFIVSNDVLLDLYFHVLLIIFIVYF